MIKIKNNLWVLCLVISSLIAAIFFGLRYFVPLPVYKPSVENLDLPIVKSPIPLPIDDVVESKIETINDTLKSKIFSPGTSEKEILKVLGEPVWRKPGFWENSIAWSYKDIVAPKIDLGYIFDSRTKKLRQGEIAVPPSTDLSTIQLALESFVQQPINTDIERGLQAVYQEEKTTYNFTLNNLEGIIKRNHKNRIYIGVWEKGFH